MRNLPAFSAPVVKRRVAVDRRQDSGEHDSPDSWHGFSKDLAAADDVRMLSRRNTSQRIFQSGGHHCPVD